MYSSNTMQSSYTAYMYMNMADQTARMHMLAWDVGLCTHIIQLLVFSWLTSELLTHCRLRKLPHILYWKSPISILGISG